jgi:hypothetical protein
MFWQKRSDGESFTTGHKTKTERHDEKSFRLLFDQRCFRTSLAHCSAQVPQQDARGVDP